MIFTKHMLARLYFALTGFGDLDMAIHLGVHHSKKVDLK